MPSPTIDAFNRLSPADAVAVLAPLFEGAPRFLGRLVEARPFESWAKLYETARATAHSMPEDEQIELINAHPRLGASPSSVSAMSFVEQGYDREAADTAVEAERARVAAELERLNQAYEARFGFRYCVFVAGRPKTELTPGFEAALSAPREAELGRALDAVVDIAEDRWLRSG